MPKTSSDVQRLTLNGPTMGTRWSALVDTDDAAQAAGLQYVHLPVAGGYQSPEEIARFAELLATLPRPILAFCRSGARATRLYMQATQA